MLHIQTFLKYCTNKTKSTVQWRAQKFFQLHMYLKIFTIFVQIGKIFFYLINTDEKLVPT